MHVRVMNKLAVRAIFLPAPCHSANVVAFNKRAYAMVYVLALYFHYLCDCEARVQKRKGGTSGMENITSSNSNAHSALCEANVGLHNCNRKATWRSQHVQRMAKKPPLIARHSKCTKRSELVKSAKLFE